MSCISDAEHIFVESPIGCIRGFINKKTPNVAQFLGIPFAEAPIGPLRWLPPVAKSSVASIEATAFGLSCPQILEATKPDVYNSDVPELKINDATSEDCLSLCIWAPTSAVRIMGQKPLPVIVWIYGGAYLEGGSTVPYQDPSHWVESSQRHMVVSIKYVPYCSG